MKSKEAPPRPFAAIPVSILDGPAFQGLSEAAKALLLEAVRQHNGHNNGHFQLTDTWLERRGWRSKSTMQRARRDLLESALIFKTREGGRAKSTLYAVAWLPISNPDGLEIWYDNGNMPTPHTGYSTPHTGYNYPTYGVQTAKKPGKRYPVCGVYVDTVRAQGVATGTGGSS